MNPPSDPLATETMASIYERQGYLDKAAAIYRAILHDAPGRSDIARRLETIENRISAQPSPGLVDLVARWLELLLQERNIALRMRRIGRR